MSSLYVMQCYSKNAIIYYAFNGRYNKLMGLYFIFSLALYCVAISDENSFPNNFFDRKLWFKLQDVEE